MDQLDLQNKAIKRLEHLRKVALTKRNKGRVQSSYQVGDYVLVHKARWPQRKIPKLESPWLGPFKIVQVRHNALKILASPTLGGVVDVAFHQCKRWLSIIDTDDSFEDDVRLAQEDEVHASFSSVNKLPSSSNAI